MKSSTIARLAHGDTVVEQECRDGRPLMRRLLAPLVAGLTVVAAAGVMFAIDPNVPGHYPVCPTRALLGIDCPGCGLMRGTHDLLHGNVAGAADHNVLLFAAIPLMIVLWIRWLNRAITGVRPALTARQFRLRNRLLIGGLVLLLIFGVVRNFVPYLESGLS